MASIAETCAYIEESFRMHKMIEKVKVITKSKATTGRLQSVLDAVNLDIWYHIYMYVNLFTVK